MRNNNSVNARHFVAFFAFFPYRQANRKFFCYTRQRCILISAYIYIYQQIHVNISNVCVYKCLQPYKIIKNENIVHPRICLFQSCASYIINEPLFFIIEFKSTNYKCLEKRNLIEYNQSHIYSNKLFIYIIFNLQLHRNA